MLPEHPAGMVCCGSTQLCKHHLVDGQVVITSADVRENGREACHHVDKQYRYFSAHARQLCSYHYRHDRRCHASLTLSWLGTIIYHLAAQCTFKIQYLHQEHGQPSR